jgi:hypothetical protein
MIANGDVVGSSGATECCINSSGSVMLTRSQVSGCLALATQGAARGGGIYAANKITLNSSTVANNEAYAQKGNAYGGGVGTKNLVMNYSTVHDNAARAPVISSSGGAYILHWRARG